MNIRYYILVIFKNFLRTYGEEKHMKRTMRKILVLIFCAILCAGIAVHSANDVDAQTKITVACNWAIKTAKNRKNGYSSYRRGRSNGIGGKNFDCSSFVCSAYKAGGFKVSISCTASMVGVFKRAGFKYISMSKLGGGGSCKNLKKGDVVWRNGHTEMYVGNGKLAGAHMDYDGRRGDSTGKEINVSKYWNGHWTGILRYKNQNAEYSDGVGSLKVQSSNVDVDGPEGLTDQVVETYDLDPEEEKQDYSNTDVEAEDDKATEEEEETEDTSTEDVTEPIVDTSNLN